MKIGERVITAKIEETAGGAAPIPGRQERRPDGLAARAAAPERLPDERRQHPARRRDQGRPELHRAARSREPRLRVRLPDGRRAALLDHARGGRARLRALGAEPVPPQRRSPDLHVLLPRAHRRRHVASGSRARRRTRSTSATRTRAGRRSRSRRPSASAPTATSSCATGWPRTGSRPACCSARAATSASSCAWWSRRGDSTPTRCRRASTSSSWTSRVDERVPDRDVEGAAARRARPAQADRLVQRDLLLRRVLRPRAGVGPGDRRQQGVGDPGDRPSARRGRHRAAAGASPGVRPRPDPAGHLARRRRRHRRIRERRARGLHAHPRPPLRRQPVRLRDRQLRQPAPDRRHGARRRGGAVRRPQRRRGPAGRRQVPPLHRIAAADPRAHRDAGLRGIRHRARADARPVRRAAARDRRQVPRRAGRRDRRERLHRPRALRTAHQGRGGANPTRRTTGSGTCGPASA